MKPPRAPGPDVPRPGLRSAPPKPLLTQEVWESTSSTSSGRSDDFPLPLQRAISDPAPQTPLRARAGVFGEAGFYEDLRRCQSWPPLNTVQPRAVTAEILAAPFHDKAHARLRAVDPGPVISPGTFALWVIFGATGWWSSNAITAQLPLLTEVLPEKNALGNKLSAMTQGGNLFLAAYMLLRHHVRMDPPAVIFIMMTLGCAALGGCAMFWDWVVSGKSVPLLAFAIIAGGVGCTSGVTYWTFLLLYPPRCTIAASVGMSLGGVLANVLSALQLCGVGHGEARFGPSAFFAVAAAMQLVGMGCFLLVRRSFPQDGELLEPLTPQEGLLGHFAGIRGQAPEEADVDPDPRQGVRAGFCSVNFLVRGITYLMPTIMPYVAGAYPEQRVLMLFWMLLGQQMGETAGRALEPSPGGVAAMGGLAAVVFAAFAAAGVSPLVMSSWLPQAYAQLVIPAACTFYFLSYGMIETAIFKRIRGVSKRIQVVEDLSAMTGSCGQMGSLVSTYLVFLCFELTSGRS